MNAVTTVANGGALVSFIERAAVDPNFDVGKFEALLRMQMEVERDQARKAFNRAMAECQAEMEPVIRTALNKHLGNKYAKLETIDRQMRPIYTRHGFSMRFGSAPSPREGDMRIVCVVAHEAGFYEENYLDAPVSTTGSQGGRMAVTPVQAVGSNITYLRRYLSLMTFNMVLADDDDDGEGSRATPRNSAQPSSAARLEPTSLRDMRPKPVPSRAEVDRILGGDDIQALAPQPQPDRAQMVADRLRERMQGVDAALGIDGPEAALAAYNAIMGNEGLKAEWAKIRDERPELDAQMQDMASQSLNAIVEAQAATVDAPA